MSSQQHFLKYICGFLFGLSLSYDSWRIRVGCNVYHSAIAQCLCINFRLHFVFLARQSSSRLREHTPGSVLHCFL